MQKGFPRWRANVGLPSRALAILIVLLVACGAPLGAAAAGASQTEVTADARPPGVDRPGTGISPYAKARAAFRTRLLSRGPAPQRYGVLAPPPPGVREIAYRSGGVRLRAWVSAAPAQQERRPAVLFLHGGFAFAAEDWEAAQPYRDAGFVVLMPMLRGENGLPGDFSMFFSEVEDVLAAADALATLPYVRADRIYVAGHSAGGTLAMFAAMSSSRFRAAASFSGSPDVARLSDALPELVPFDRTDPAELRIRSPIAFATSFRCPARLYFGSDEQDVAAITEKLAELAQEAGLDVVALAAPGDHFSHAPAAMRHSIRFFRDLE